MSVQSQILDERPEDLAGAHDPAEALDAVLSLERLSAGQEGALRYALAFWVMQALSRATDMDSLALLDKLCVAAARRAGKGAEGEFAVRLRTHRDLLEHKRQAIAAGRSGRADRLLKAQPILNALEGGALTQAQLSELLKVTPGRISQLLSVMEEAQLVRRERKGRESVVTRVRPADVSVRDERPVAVYHHPRPMRAFQLMPAAA